MDIRKLVLRAYNASYIHSFLSALPFLNIAYIQNDMIIYTYNYSVLRLIFTPTHLYARCKEYIAIAILCLFTFILISINWGTY